MNAPAEKLNQAWSLGDYYRESGVQDSLPFADAITIGADADGNNIIPSPHQIRNLNRVLLNGMWGYYDEPGTGKTLPAQAWAIYMMEHGYRVLAIMPPTLLNQFKREMHRVFIGSDKYSIHILNEGPYPIRVSKRRVQQIKAKLVMNELVTDAPRNIVKYVDGIIESADIPFSQRMIDQIRSDNRAAPALSEALGCSTNAIQLIRRERLREDLFNEWGADESWPQMLIMGYQMFNTVAHDVQDHYPVIIADEAHALCHPSSHIHKKVYSFSKGAGGNKAVLFMTGTPMPNVMSDAYGLIRILNQKAYSSYSQFEALHCDVFTGRGKNGRRFKQVTGYKNFDMLHINLFAKGSRVLLDDVVTLKKLNVIEVEVELSEKHAKLYRRLIKDRVLSVAGKTISAVEAQSLRQKALRIVTCPDQFTDQPIKDNNVRAMLEELLDEIGCANKEKVVMFAIYNDSIKAMAQWFEKLNPALVYGGSNTEKNVEKFLNDDTCRLMIAHPLSGGVGLNLQNVCRYGIFAEPTSVPGWFEQSVKRYYRRGQNKASVLYVLKVLRTGWPKMVNSMRGKMRTNQKVTLDKTQLLNELLGE